MKIDLPEQKDTNVLNTLAPGVAFSYGGIIYMVIDPTFKYDSMDKDKMIVPTVNLNNGVAFLMDGLLLVTPEDLKVVPETVATNSVGDEWGNIKK